MKQIEKKRFSIKRAAVRMIVLFLFVFIGFYLVFYFAQTSMVFHSERELKRDPSLYKLAYENILLPVRGETTHGWYVPLENHKGVIFFCHGNDGNMGTRLGAIKLFRSLGFSVLTYDYGGFGKSTGEPSEKRVYADSEAMWSHLTGELKIPSDKIIIWGRSFGGGAACELARNVKSAGVILEATFSSMSDAAFADYPWFPGELFLRHKFSNKKKVSEFKCPLLVLHSRGDELYPFHHGQELFDRAQEPKSLVEVYGKHGQGYIASKDIYEKGVKEFIDSIFSTPSGV